MHQLTPHQSRLLFAASVLYWGLAGASGFSAIFVLAYWQNTAFAGLLFGLFLLLWSVGVCIYVRRAYVYILTVSAFVSMIFPFGTAVGIFTILMLLNDDIRLGFAGQRE